jgi:tetratricopeptide (TPR) repeat protein
MFRSSVIRTLLVGACALTLALVAAAPAWAQLTAVIRGKVVDEAGAPQPGAEVKGEFVGDVVREFTIKTDKNGQFLRAGLAPGTWKLTATLNGKVANLTSPLNLGDPLVVNLVLGEPKNAPPAGMTKKEVEASNKKQEELQKQFDAAKAAFDAGDFDTAITNLQAMTTTAPDCAACYASLGDAYAKKNDNENAEKAYLKAVELDQTKPAPYAALATIYNAQKKFDEAGKMSAKANELSEAAGGGGDAASIFNQGVILWNQSKAPEAEVQFEKATKLDPKMADAFYWLGMARVNQGKLPEAKAPFQEYMKLAPTGQYAEQVKAMLDVIK